jgi:hypothetical protein
MDRFGFRIVFGVLAIAALIAVGAYTYNLGVARGMVESGRMITSPATGVPVVAVWHPWGFGFFPLFPLLFIFLWVFVLRALFWGGRWRRPWRYDGVPPAFEEWHRRAHAAESAPRRRADTNA